MIKVMCMYIKCMLKVHMTLYAMLGLNCVLYLHFRAEEDILLSTAILARSIQFITDDSLLSGE